MVITMRRTEPKFHSKGMWRNRYILSSSVTNEGFGGGGGCQVVCRVHDIYTGVLSYLGTH